MSLEKTLPQFNALNSVTVTDLFCGYQTDLGHWSGSQIKTFTGLSAYIVGKDATKFVYTSIQTAITAAALVATSSIPITIYITPGIYTENVTLAPFVNLICTTSMSNAYDINVGSSITAQVVILGNMTLNFSNTIESVSVYGVSIKSPNATPGLTISSTGFGSYIFENCIMDGSNAIPLFSTSDNTGTEFINCTFFANANGLWYISTGLVKFIGCGGIVTPTTTPSTVLANTQVIIERCRFLTPIQIGTNTNVSIFNSYIGIGGDLATLTITSDGLVEIYNSEIFCNASSGYFTAGSGAIRYSNLSPISSAYKINPSTTILGVPSQVGNNISFDGVNFLGTGQIWIGGTGNPLPAVPISTDGTITITSGDHSLDFELTGPVSSANGGTGVNNGSNTLTLGASVTTSANLDLSTSANTRKTIGLTQSYIQSTITTSGSLSAQQTYVSLTATISGTTFELNAANLPDYGGVSSPLGMLIFIKNTGDYAISILTYGGFTTILNLAPRESIVLTLTDNSTSAGVYDYWALPPSQNSTVSISGTSWTMDNRAEYMPTSSSLTTFTLPSTAAVGDWFRIIGQGSGGWKIAQNSSQKIHLNSSVTTTGTGGSLASTNANNCIYLQCTVTNTDFTVVSSSGNLTPV